MKNIIPIIILLLPQTSWAQEDLDVLLNGLHLDAHKGNFESYFDRYSADAVFLGTDKTERWTIEEFKAYAKPAFSDGHGWTYAVIERNWEGDGNTRWFDEILLNEKLGHCRGTGVVELTRAVEVRFEEAKGYVVEWPEVQAKIGIEKAEG
jgi:hypothetical protein